MRVATIRTNSALVKRVGKGACGVPRERGCLRVTAQPLDGQARGPVTSFTILGQVGGLALKPNYHIRVSPTASPRGRLGPRPHARRRRVLRLRPPGAELWLGIGLVVLLLATGRLQGLGALIRLAASLALVAESIIPAIQHGRSPLESP